MKKAARFIMVLLVLIGAWSLFMGSLPIVFSQDAKEAGGIVKHVADHYDFYATSKVAPERKPVFCTPGARRFGAGRMLFGPVPHRIEIYSITETNAQNEILDLIRGYRSKMGLRPVRVVFYREENWTVHTNNDGSVAGGSRGKEEVLRSVNLE
jgi:hypothetical protein